MALRNGWTQWFPPAPTLTEENLPSQAGKVFLVTGGNAGIGFELTKILYSKGATVYMASRSQAKADEAIKAIKASHTGDETGRLEYLHLDLNDLTTIKASAADFAARETKLDVLWNNAGVGTIPVGSVTKQGIEQSVGVNCIAPFLFTQLLIPQLRNAAKSAPKNSVRIIWTSSWLAEMQGAKGGTLNFDELAVGTKDNQHNYATSKVGNWLLAVECAKRYGGEGILSLAQNPGNLASNIWSSVPKATMMLVGLVLHKVVFGAYTELYAGLSPDITAADNGGYVIPWGRIQRSSHRKDILLAIKDKEEGGSALASRFWTWCEEQVEKYT